MAVIQKEVRKRGFFGKVVLCCFIIFNIIMLLWLIGGMSAAGDHYNSLTDDASRAGAAIGTALGAGFIVAIWVFGDIILGIFTLLTRGTKYITTIDSDKQ